jgi:hypothetical protein
MKSVKERLVVTACAWGLLSGVATGGTSALVLACHPTPAQSADLAKLESVALIVFADIGQDKTYEQTLADVGQAVAGQAGADAAAILDEVIQLLVDTGEIQETDGGVPMLARAKAIQARAHAARGAAK